jgi:hypothetical protein
MTNTSKNKIRVEDSWKFENTFNFTSDKLTPEEFKDFIGEQIREKVQEIVFGTGERHIHLGSLNLTVDCEKDFDKDDSFNIRVKSEFVYSRLERDNEYKDRLYVLNQEQKQLELLAVKFGYKLEKVNE